MSNHNAHFLFQTARNIYSAGFYLALPFLKFVQNKRVRQGKEDLNRLGERKGIASIPRPSGDVIWIHAASVGEVLSILPLIDASLKRWPDLSIVLTTVTVTSAKILQERRPDGVYHQYAPLDHGPWIRRFLDYWRPSCVLWVESEFWPNTLSIIKEKRIPLILVNGRVSPRSYERWRKHLWAISGMLSLFDLCLAQSETDLHHLLQLGGSNVRLIGNLKLAAPSLPVNEDALRQLKLAIGERPRWLLSSSHPGEEALALAVHQQLSITHPDLLTIIAPRHPDRGDAIASIGKTAGIRVRQRSKGELPDDRTDIYIADTIGELGVLYQACPIVVIGKSLLPPGGGQNPYEPAKMGCVVLFGPYMGNFVELSQSMLLSGAATQIDDSDQLCKLLGIMLDAPEIAGIRSAAALEYCTHFNTIIEETIDALSGYLARPARKLQG